MENTSERKPSKYSCSFSYYKNIFVTVYFHFNGTYKLYLQKKRKKCQILGKVILLIEKNWTLNNLKLAFYNHFLRLFSKRWRGRLALVLQVWYKSLSSGVSSWDNREVSRKILVARRQLVFLLPCPLSNRRKYMSYHSYNLSALCPGIIIS